jgi:hypothetical protein
MTIEEMIAAIAQDAYEGATEAELRQVFVEVLAHNLGELPSPEIKRIYTAIVEGE